MTDSIDEVPALLRKNGLADIAAEWELMQEVLAFYANDEDRYMKAAVAYEEGRDPPDDAGEPFGSIPTEVGMKARQHRAAFQRREPVTPSDDEHSCPCGGHDCSALPGGPMHGCPYVRDSL